MTDEELAEMERRAAGWPGEFRPFGVDLTYVPRGEGGELERDLWLIDQIDDGARQIAAMLNGIPALLAEVRRLRGEVAELTEQRDEAVRGYEGMSVLADEFKAERDAVRNELDLMNTCWRAEKGRANEWALKAQAAREEARRLQIELPRLRGERARVVAWLRERGTIEGDEYADAIEAGAHDKEAT